MMIHVTKHLKTVHLFVVALAILLNMSLVSSQTQTEITEIAWSPDLTQIAFGYRDGTVEIVDAVSGNLQASFIGHTERVLAFAWHPDPSESLLASGGSDKTIKVWDVSSVSGSLPVLSLQHPDRVLGVFWTPDGSQIWGATEFAPDNIYIWDGDPSSVAFGDLIGIETLPSGLGTISINPIGDMVATIGSRATIYIYDISPVNELKTFKQSDERGTDAVIVSWHPTDPNIIAIGDIQGMVTIWDISPQIPVTIAALPANDLSPNSENAFIDNNVQDVKFHPNGEILYAVSTDGTVRAWETNTWQVLETLSLDTTTTEARFTGADRRLIYSEDDTGTDTFDTVTINVGPVAAGTASHSIGRFSLPPGIDPHPGWGQEISIVLDASASVDPDGSIVEYNWGTFAGDDSLYSGTQTNTFATITVSGCGAPAVYLTVIDNDGATDTIAVTVSDYFGSC